MTKLHADLLFPSKEKIKRARVKFDYLKVVINRYVSSEPYSTRRTVDGDTLYIIGSLDKAPPEEIAWELVEAVLHLRSALDKMAVALVEKNGKGTSGVGFPFGGRSDGKTGVFPTARMELGIKQKFTSDQWDMIVAQKPYPGGNDMLWAINQIANADKHWNELVEVTPLADPITHITASVDALTGYTWDHMSGMDCGVLSDKNREIVILSIKPLPHRSSDFSDLELRGEIPTSIVFGPVDPVEGKNVLATLNEQIRLVEGIVNVFDRAFF